MRIVWHATDDFGVSDTTDEISLWGLTPLDPQNSMKIRENPENIRPGLWIILHPNTMRYFSHSQTFRKLINIKIWAWK